MRKQYCYDNSRYSQELSKRIFLDNLTSCTKFPKYFSIGTTDFCNAKCKMCPHSKETKQGHIMDESLFNKIVRQLKSYNEWIESVAIYWYGEPLLDYRISDRIKKLKEIGIKNIQISTNGANLNVKNAQCLFEAGLNDLRFSIDAIKKETYEKIRKGLDYDQVVRNVLDVIKYRNQNYPQVSIRIRLTQMEDNLNEVDDFVNYWRGVIESCDKVQIMPLHTQENWSMESDKIISLEKYPCISLFSTMVIDTDGKVPICCLDTDKKFLIGDLYDDSILNIWNSEILHNLRMKHLNSGRQAISMCRECNCWDRTFLTYSNDG